MVLGDYEAVMPLPYKKRYGLRILYQPFFAQQLGVFYKKPIKSETEEAFFAQIGTRYIEAHQYLNASNAGKLASWQKSSRVNYILFLNEAYENVRSRYSKNTRRNLRKSERLGLQLAALEIDQLLDLFRNSKGKELDHFTDEVYQRLRRLIVLCLQEGKGELKAVYTSDGSLLAGAFFLCSHGRIIDLFPASSDQGRDAAAMTYLLDQQIQMHADTGLLLDFEGSMVPGVARFYRGFGAEVETYWQISGNLLPWPLNRLKDWFSSSKA